MQQNANSSNRWIHQTVEFTKLLNSSKPVYHVHSNPTNPCKQTFCSKMADTVEFKEWLWHSLLDLGRRLQNSADEDTVDFVMFRLRHINRHLLHFERYTEVVRSISAVIVLLESEEESRVNHNFPGYCVAPCGSVGRPKFDITREQLEYMINYNISLSKIAHALGVSKSTIKQRVREYGISVRLQEGILSDSELEALVRDIQREFPNAGYQRIYSQLKSRSVKVTQARVRETIHRTDPEGIAMRWLSITPRAAYSVRGPLSLWHIDGNHTLIW